MEWVHNFCVMLETLLEYMYSVPTLSHCYTSVTIWHVCVLPDNLKFT